MYEKEILLEDNSEADEYELLSNDESHYNKIK